MKAAYSKFVVYVIGALLLSLMMHQVYTLKVANRIVPDQRSALVAQVAAPLASDPITGTLHAGGGTLRPLQCDVEAGDGGLWVECWPVVALPK